MNTTQQTKMKKRQAHFFDRSILLEESGNPQLVQQLLIFSGAVILAFLIWATITKVDEVALAPGTILPSGKVRHLQHKDGGIVKQLLVKEGQTVSKGDLLLEMEDSELKSRAKAISMDLDLMTIRREFLAAFLENRPWQVPEELASRHPAMVQREADISKVLKEKMASFENSLKSKTIQAQNDLATMEERIVFLQEKVALLDSALSSMEDHHKKTLAENLKERDAMKEEVAMREKLIERGLNTKLNILSLNRQMASMERGLSDKEQAYSSERNQTLQTQLELREELKTLPLARNKMQEALAQAQHDHESFIKSERLTRLEELRELNLSIAKLSDEGLRIDEQLKRTQVTAPIDGRVQNISVYTIGGVLAPGSQVMDIVPMAEGLVAELNISTRDIGHVKVGFPVRLKFSNYDFSKYGYIDAVLDDISPTTISGKAGETFLGTVKVPKSHLDEVHALFPIQPGMKVNGDIISGNKRIIEYLLKPIFSTAQQALRER